MGSVDFDECMRRVKLADVLALLGWRHVWWERGDRLGWCPLCGEGKGWDRCFRARGERWVCYKCHRSGGVLDLYREASGLGIVPATRELFRRLGRKLPYRPRMRKERSPQSPR